jgi:hypothetical protein
MKRFVSLLLLTLFLLSQPTLSQTDNGCKLKFLGKDVARKAVKMRPPTKDYPLFKNGDAISVKEFLNPLCLEASKKVFKKLPKGAAMPIEEQTVTIRAFVLAMKLDKTDNDLHIQIGDKAKPYKQAQIIVEIPPTNKYCDARTKMMDLFREDGGTKLSQWIFKDPPEVEFTGYLFLDSHHGATCSGSGGRGIKNGLKKSPVKSTWEIHPVISMVSIT